jgi:hypothetical protein
VALKASRIVWGDVSRLLLQKYLDVITPKDCDEFRSFARTGACAGIRNSKTQGMNRTVEEG